MPYQSFEELEVWQRACRLAVRVYEILKDCRDYRLKDQMTGSAVSIASNIAEGAERNSKKEFVQFLHISKGSAGELRTQAYIAADIGLISPPEQQAELLHELKALSSMLHSLIKSVK